MNILVLAGSMWHPSEMIRRGLADISDYHFDFVEDAKDLLTSEMLACYPVILCCKSNNLTGSTDAPWFEENVTEVMPKEIRAFVEKGGGFRTVAFFMQRFQSTLPIREETWLRRMPSTSARDFNPLFPYGKRRQGFETV